MKSKHITFNVKKDWFITLTLNKNLDATTHKGNRERVVIFLGSIESRGQRIDAGVRVNRWTTCILFLQISVSHMYLREK